MPKNPAEVRIVMNFNVWFRRGWWVLVTIICSYVVWPRIPAIQSGTGQILDTVLVGITAALLLVPVFSEFNLLGVSLKQEVEDAKKELKQEIKDLSLSVRSDLANLVTVSPQFYVGQQSQPQMDEMTLKRVLKSAYEEMNIAPSQIQSVQGLEAPPDAAFAFGVRYALEQELLRLTEGRIPESGVMFKRPPAMWERVEFLVATGVLPTGMGTATKEVMGLCNRAIHGQGLTGDQLTFIREAASGIVAALRMVKAF